MFKQPGIGEGGGYLQDDGFCQADLIGGKLKILVDDIQPKRTNHDIIGYDWEDGRRMHTQSLEFLPQTRREFLVVLSILHNDGF